jgi:two-component system OmpR family response regulator
MHTSAALCTILTQRGYSVSTAENGEQAIDLLERGIRPKLILIDLLLPRLSGHDVLRHLNAHPDLRTIPTIVITAVPKEQVSVITNAVFSKPLDFAKLTRAVDVFVGGRVTPNSPVGQ